MMTVSMTRNLIEHVLVLVQDAELARPHDRAALRLVLARQQLHEGGLAGAVRAGEAVAPTDGERRGDVLEEDLEPNRIETPLTEIMRRPSRRA